MKIIYGILIALVLIQCQEAPTIKEISILQKAQMIHLKTTTVDTHDDINVKNFTDSINYTQDTKTQEVTSLFPNFVFVCPSNWGSPTFTCSF